MLDAITYFVSLDLRKSLDLEPSKAYPGNQTNRDRSCARTQWSVLNQVILTIYT